MYGRTGTGGRVGTWGRFRWTSPAPWSVVTDVAVLASIFPCPARQTNEFWTKNDPEEQYLPIEEFVNKKRLVENGRQNFYFLAILNFLDQLFCMIRTNRNRPTFAICTTHCNLVALHCFPWICLWKVEGYSVTISIWSAFATARFCCFLPFEVSFVSFPRRFRIFFLVCHPTVSDFIGRLHKMVSVTRENIRELLPEIEDSITRACFVGERFLLFGK